MARSKSERPNLFNYSNIKKSLTKENVFNIIDKYDLDSSNLYTNLADIKKYSGVNQEYKTIFEQYCFDRNKDISTYFYKKEMFFKYMPILHSFVNKTEVNLHLDSHYCCEDHDGNYNDYKLSALEFGDVYDIKTILSNIKIK